MSYGFTGLRSLAAPALALAALAASGQALAQTKLLFNVFMPRNHHHFTEVMEPWAKQAEAATAGRVRIEFSAASLAPIPRQFDMVQKGIADLGYDQTIFNANRFEMAKIVEFPFVSDKTEALAVALWRTHDRYFAKANEYEGVKVLGFFSTGPSYVWTNGKKPIAKLDDLRGLKIRMTGVYIRELAQALGVVPVAEPGPKTFELVANGVVDGTGFGWIDVVNFKLANQLKYVVAPQGGIYSAGFAFILNKAKWDALSKADQDALMSVSGEAHSRLAGKAWDRADDKARAELMKSGLKEINLDAAALGELKRKLSGIEESWLAAAQKKGVDGKAALAYFRDQIAAVEKEK